MSVVNEMIEPPSGHTERPVDRKRRAVFELLTVSAAFWVVMFQDWIAFNGPLAVILAAVIITVSLARRGETWRSLGLKWPTGLKGTGAGALLTLLIFLSVMIETVIAQPVIGALFGAYEQTVPDVSTVQNYLIMMALAWSTAAIGEELVFRGFMMTRLVDLFGESWIAKAAAALIPAIIFGAAHAYQGLPGMVLTGTVGLVFGIWYLVGRRNLLPLIFGHGLVNTFGLTLLHLISTGVIDANIA